MLIVENEPGLPNPPASERNVLAWAAQLVVRCTKLLRDIATRANGALPKEGTEAMTGPLGLATYTLATRPTGTDPRVIYVSDAAANNRFQAWDTVAGAWVVLG
jgi:hypothetical protein